MRKTFFILNFKKILFCFRKLITFLCEVLRDKEIEIALRSSLRQHIQQLDFEFRITISEILVPIQVLSLETGF